VRFAVFVALGILAMPIVGAMTQTIMDPTGDEQSRGWIPDGSRCTGAALDCSFPLAGWMRSGPDVLPYDLRGSDFDVYAEGLDSWSLTPALAAGTTVYDFTATAPFAV